MLKKVDPLEQILLDQEKINSQTLKEIKTNNFRNGNYLGKTLVEHGYINSQTLLETLSQQMNLPYLRYEDYPKESLPIPEFEVSDAFLRDQMIFPLKMDEGKLTICVFNPFNHFALEELNLAIGREIEICLSSEEDILQAIETFYGQGSSAMDRMVESIQGEDITDLDAEEDSTEHIKDMASEAPVIKLVNHILSQAIELGASDIHLEPFLDDMILRYRIDGMLHDFESPPKKLHSALSTRIKIMAKLDISERRLPQDGRIRLKAMGKDIDLRVSTLPTLYGESVVMRILDRGNIMVDLDHLGFPDKELQSFQSLIQKPYGKILVTGPTGSGKSTTLYASLQKINTPDKKIITIEDPVEYQLRGVNQIHVKPSIGLTFVNGLRSIVRQDPDVIMVGEIRDPETADISIQAALTGHLVFSTVHTNDSAGAITRLQDMGIESFLISSALLGVLAQRLVRVICQHCKLELPLEPALVKEMGPWGKEGMKVFRGQGCKKCAHTGFRGRCGIYELLVIDEAVRELILSKASSHIIRSQARKTGMRTLREDGWDKVLNGQTTVEEVLRVTLDDQG